jgi:hypothetical protein
MYDAAIGWVRDWPALGAVLKPGAHVACLGGLDDALLARAVGLEFRDTVAVVGPGGWFPVMVFRKPLEGTVAENTLEHGVGGLNIEVARVGYASVEDRESNQFRPGRGQGDGNHAADLPHLSSDWGAWSGGRGRWPPNMVLEHAAGCERVGVKRVKGSHDTTGVWGNAGPEVTYGKWADRKGVRQGFTSPDGLETVEAWECAPGCPVRALDEQSGGIGAGNRSPHENPPVYGQYPTRDDGAMRAGVGYSDSGAASRFFPQEDWVGWVLRLICPVGGRVLEVW